MILKSSCEWWCVWKVSRVELDYLTERGMSGAQAAQLIKSAQIRQKIRCPPCPIGNSLYQSKAYLCDIYKFVNKIPSHSNKHWKKNEISPDGYLNFPLNGTYFWKKTLWYKFWGNLSWIDTELCTENQSSTHPSEAFRPKISPYVIEVLKKLFYKPLCEKIEHSLWIEEIKKAWKF